MPLLQTLATASARGWRGNGAVGVYELISTIVLASNATSVTFSITGAQQAAYKHLQIRAVGRTTDAQAYADLYARFNNDSATNYGWHYISGVGSGTPSSGWASSQTGIFVGRVTGNTATGSNFASSVTDIIDAFSSSKNKVTRMLGGEVDSSYYQSLMTSGLWLNTAAISSITLFSNQGGNLITGSRFSLYGVRA
jgi:hypothetical protein